MDYNIFKHVMFYHIILSYNLYVNELHQIYKHITLIDIKYYNTFLLQLISNIIFMVENSKCYLYSNLMLIS